MTYVQETDRFKAKCAAGNTYTIIENTKETKEPRTLNEHVYETSRKYYFLLTGEKVNKLAEDTYLIINKKRIITKDKPRFKKSYIGDLKTVFDYLKNQALLIAIVLAIPEIVSIIANAHLGSWVTLLGFSIATSMATVFSVYNLIWLHYTLEEKPKQKTLRILTLVFTFTLAAAAMAVAALKTFHSLIPHLNWLTIN
jgi:hypothetical protein